jgi:hypothetical protein
METRLVLSAVKKSCLQLYKKSQSKKFKIGHCGKPLSKKSFLTSIKGIDPHSVYNLFYESFMVYAREL